MTPMIVKKDGKVVLATGSPGGSTIITSVLQMVLNVIEWDMNLVLGRRTISLSDQLIPAGQTLLRWGISGALKAKRLWLK